MPASSAHGPQPWASSWFAIDLATYLAGHGITAGPRDGAPLDADVIIVGSGYGAAAALKELAGQHLPTDGDPARLRPLRILMLERGETFLPGAFPDRLSDVPGHVAVSTRPAQLFEVHPSADLNVLVASGLGGGSLINAGVMAVPDTAVFQHERWPSALRAAAPSADDFKQMAADLKASPAADVPGRRQALQPLAPARWRAADITVAQSDDPALGVSACKACGDCFTGCNVGAKLSLDVTLLAQAWRAHPEGQLHIVTGALVDTVLPEGAHWSLRLQPSDTGWRRRETQPYTLRAQAIIVAAGVMGSTQIMLRSRHAGLHTSPTQLGQGLSANGDGVATLMGLPQPTQAVASNHLPIDRRAQGPTITGMLDLRQAPADQAMLVQDLGVPAAMRGIFEALIFSQRQVHRLVQRADTAAGGAHQADPAHIDPAESDRSLLVALIGHDAADGVMTLATSPAEPAGPGLLAGGMMAGRGLRIDAAHLKADPRFHSRFQALAQRVRDAHPQATLLPHPSHRPLPAALERVFDAFTGPLITVHPLGGCRMADDGQRGVVNHLGQVFDGPGRSVHPQLLVLDGGIVPTSLGANPALTIAVLARRALRGLMQATAADQAPAATPSLWTRLQRPAQAIPDRPLPPRPRQRALVSPEPETPTEIELAECMDIPLRLQLPGEAGPRDCLVQMAMCFAPVAIQQITQRHDPGPLRMPLVPERSTLRVFAQPQPGQPPRELLMSAQLRGHIDWLVLERHDASLDHLRTLGHWLCNRGLSDTVKWLQDRWFPQAGDGDTRPAAAQRKQGLPGPWGPWGGLLDEVGARADGAIKLATHASHQRWMKYELAIDERLLGLDDDVAWQAWRGQPIRFDKRLAYGPAANPLRQLMGARLHAFPHRVDPTPAAVRLDLGHTRRIGFPLIRVVRQHNQAMAIADLAQLLLYMARALLPIHIWSMRLPDRRPAPAGVAHRLPADLPGLTVAPPLPVSVDSGAASGPVHIQLRRYRDPAHARSPALAPVLLIHGYSASGSTFAHPALPEGGLAGHLARKGRDVWVLDLRSSAGLPTGTAPWTFEHMAFQDIPKAVAAVVQATGAARVDVVAHCMGAAMLSLALLGQVGADEPINTAPSALAALPGRIGRIVMSQVTPAFMLTPANVTRAHIFQWLRYYVSQGSYSFTPWPRGEGDNMLDRLLALVPYPSTDFRRENPILPPWQRTPWSLTRHRMDALYGQTFKLARMGDAVLDAIDDFFGPMNLATLAEVIHYGRYRLVTRHDGAAAGNRPSNVAQAFAGHPLLTLHSLDNGMIDAQTMALTTAHFEAARQARARQNPPPDAQISHQAIALPGHGHQDALIGTHASETFGHISAFLNQTGGSHEATST